MPPSANWNRPGLFATARIERRDRTPGVLAPASAVQTAAGISHVFVVNGDKGEERIVTTGQVVGDRMEIVTGVKAGEKVATKNVGQLVDGAAVKN